MADPISITSAVALASHVICRCYSYGCGVAEAPKETRKLLDEITVLSGLLLGLQHFLVSEKVSAKQRESIDSAIGECHRTLREIRDALNKVKSESSSRKDKIGMKVKTLLWPLHRDQTMKVVERLERQKNILSLAISTESAIGTLEMQIVLADVQRSLEQERMERRARETADSNSRVLRWLSAVNYEEKHSRAAALQHPDTGQWLLNSLELRSWICGKEKFLWIHGIPGSGKTVWTSIILNRCVLPERRRDVFAAYFFCDFRDAASRRPEAVLGGLIAQICAYLSPFPNEVKEAMQKHTGKDGKVAEVSFEEAKRLLRHILKLCPEVTLVVDALDECDDRDDLLGFLVDLTRLDKSNAKVLVTSRLEQDIQKAFQGQLQLSVLSSAADEEIHRLITSSVTIHPKFQKLGTSLKEYLISSLSEGAGGMYRWVRCQLDELSKLRTAKSIRDAVKALPQTLNETYERILDNIDPHDRVLARRALLWLAYSRRPLSLDELAEAIVFEPECTSLDPETRLSDPEDVLSICGSLIALTPSNEVVLAHNSVREYLVHPSTANQSPFFHLTDDMSNRDIASTCIRYLLLSDFSTGPISHEAQDRRYAYPLISYSTHSFAGHLLASLPNQLEYPPKFSDPDDPLTLASVLLSPTPPPQFYAWAQNLLSQLFILELEPDQWPFTATPLYYAASFGITPLVAHLITSGVDIDARGGIHGGTALHAACWRQNYDVIEMLLLAGADTSVCDSHSMTAADLARVTGDFAIGEIFRRVRGVELEFDSPVGLVHRKRVVR